ncbi:MAG: hypothetical protein QM599_01810 [Pseudoxanthomonas sp.]
MDPLQAAHLSRAQSAIIAAGVADNHAQRVDAFFEVAKALACNRDHATAMRVMENSPRAQVAAFAKAAMTSGDGWPTAEGQTLAEAYLASIAPLSLLDGLAKYARILPQRLEHVLVASDAVANIATEGAPKPVITPALSLEEAQSYKPAAIIALTREFELATGVASGRKLLERELTAAILRAMNQAVVGHFTPTATAVAATGEPLADLRAGLQACAASLGYVVACSPGVAADLATRSEARNMTVAGGTFVEGVEVVGVEGQTGLLIVPASGVALRDEGLQLRGALHATIDMRETPQSPAQQVSLWQANTIGLLAERLFAIGGTAQAVLVAED